MQTTYSLDKINALSAGDSQFLQQVIGLFLQEIPEEINLIKEAIDTHNFEQVYASSHKIKPSLELLGLEKAYHHNLELEAWTGKENEISKNKRSLFKV